MDFNTPLFELGPNEAYGGVLFAIQFKYPAVARAILANTRKNRLPKNIILTTS